MGHQNHHFRTDLAAIYGIEEAILIENIAFWILKNEANKMHYHKERYWTYNSSEAFHQIFYYMSSKKISRILKKLVDNGVLLSDNFNEKGFDRTTWYSLSEEIYGLYSTPKAVQPLDKKDPSIRQKCPMQNPLVSNALLYTDINADINADKENPKEKTFQNLSILEDENICSFSEDGNPSDCVLSSEEETKNTHKQPNIIKHTETFEIFYKAYPKKQAKEAALKAWLKLKPNEALQKIILEAIGIHKQTEKWQEMQGKYIPYPATWLNGKRWTDDVGILYSLQPQNEPEKDWDEMERERMEKLWQDSLKKEQEKLEMAKRGEEWMDEYPPDGTE